jgi:uncharacterized protein (TIGR00369 family)
VRAPDAATVALLRSWVEERICFNGVLGIELERFAFDEVRLGFGARPDLVGNFVRGTLHGGVISSVLDTAGGLAALAGVLGHARSHAPEHCLELFGRLGTIDLRVDYLRPGLGERFHATATILRAGRRVSVTRMELRNAGTLLAVGTGTYIVA